MTIFDTIFNLISQFGSTPKAGAPAPIPTDPDVSFDVPEEPKNLAFPQFPDRPEAAKSGSEFSTSIFSMGPTKDREVRIFSEVASGNIPNFTRYFVEIQVIIGSNTIKYLVCPDYLSVGENSNFLRVPLDPITAQAIAKNFNCTLPTPKMARQIWNGASVKLEPIPNGPPYDAYMQSVDAFTKHNAKIEKARAGQPLGKLVAGHKKDVVICKALLTNISRVAIYGWFHLNGQPIQDLNPTSHDKGYKDYSHGIRLVSRNVLINDQPHDLFDVLKDPFLCNLISDEGAYDASTIYSR